MRGGSNRDLRRSAESKYKELEEVQNQDKIRCRKKKGAGMNSNTVC